MCSAVRDVFCSLPSAKCAIDCPQSYFILLFCISCRAVFPCGFFWFFTESLGLCHKRKSEFAGVFYAIAKQKNDRTKPTTPCRGVVSAPEGEYVKMLFLKRSKEPQINSTERFLSISQSHLCRFRTQIRHPFVYLYRGSRNDSPTGCVHSVCSINRNLYLFLIKHSQTFRAAFFVTDYSRHLSEKITCKQPRSVV